MFGKEEQKIEDLLKSIVEKDRHLNQRMAKDKVQDAWKTLFGDQFDQYVDSLYFSKNILYLKLNSSVLRQELHLGKQKLMERLNEVLENELIKEIRLK